MGGFNFGGGNQNTNKNSIENIDSHEKIQARSEEKQKVREEMETKFKNTPEYSIIKKALYELNLRETKITEVLNKVLFKFEKNPKNFNFIDGLGKVINGENQAIGIVKINLEGVITNEELFITLKEKLTQRPKNKTILKDSAQKDVLDSFGEAIGIGGHNHGESVLDDIHYSEKNTRSKNPKLQSIISSTVKKLDIIEPSKLDILKDSPNYPILVGLRNNGQILEKTFNQTINALSTAKKNDEKTIVSKAFQTIGDKKVKSEMMGFISGKKETTQENFPKSSLSQDIKSVGVKIENIGNLEVNLANNYINIPIKNGHNNKKEDFGRSIEITLNNIIRGNDKKFRREHDNIISKIRGSTNLQYKYEQLQILHKKDLQDDAKKHKEREKNTKILHQDKIEKKSVLDLQLEQINKRLTQHKSNVHVNTLIKTLDKGVVSLGKENKELQKIIDKTHKEIQSGKIKSSTISDIIKEINTTIYEQAQSKNH